MNPIFDFAKWLLEKNIRTKNAISVLLALVALAVFCFCTQDVKWLAKLSQHGPLAFPVVLFVVFLITLLTVSLISSAIVHFLDRASRERKRLAAADKKEAHIFKTLESLTGWQQGFVLRYIVENTTQIQEFEVGEYHAVWKPEMEMLAHSKGNHSPTSQGSYL